MNHTFGDFSLCRIGGTGGCWSSVGSAGAGSSGVDRYCRFGMRWSGVFHCIWSPSPVPKG